MQMLNCAFQIIFEKIFLKLKILQNFGTQRHSILCNVTFVSKVNLTAGASNSWFEESEFPLELEKASKGSFVLLHRNTIRRSCLQRSFQHLNASTFTPNCVRSFLSAQDFFLSPSSLLILILLPPPAPVFSLSLCIIIYPSFKTNKVLLTPVDWCLVTH